MRKFTPEELKGKFVIAYDTMLQGWGCVTTNDDEGNDIPAFSDSREDALLEIIGDALSKWLHSDLSERRECGVKMRNVKVLDKLYDKAKAEFDKDKTVGKAFEKMETYFNLHDQVNDNGEWVEPAETFIMNRQFIVGSDEEGKLTSFIAGKKLTEA